jgi:predicted dinucleotide-binding enzyme
MKIGILGSGNIGGALGRLWAAAGHQVFFSSRHPERLTGLLQKAGPDARAGCPEEAADFGEVILEAVPFGHVSNLPVEHMTNKVVLSAANYYPSRDGQIDLGGRTESEWVASRLPGTRLVKAFNMMRAAVMEELADGRGRPGLAIFIASDDEEAKHIASGLVSDARFTPVDVGPLRSGALFQTNAPLYDTQMDPEQARKAVQEATS